MDRQRRYQWLFGVFVRGIGAARYTRASAPIVAGMALCVAGFTANHLPQPDLVVESRLGGVDLSGEPQGSPLMAESVYGTRHPVSLTTPLGAVKVAAPVLSREQQNIVRFIEKTYQVAAEQTQWFVEHAYRTARDLKIDPMLILAVISVESNFDPRAQSNRGAQGLMQVLTRVHADKFSPFGGVAAAFDPMANIRVGAQILNKGRRQQLHVSVKLAALQQRRARRGIGAVAEFDLVEMRPRPKEVVVAHKVRVEANRIHHRRAERA